MQDVMLDLETFGTKAGCVVRSLGAVFFDLNGGVGYELYRNIERKSCEAAGLTVDPNTEAWWLKQEASAQAAFLVDQKPLTYVAREFANWFKTKGGKRVWCQGANFDAPLWEAASTAVGQMVPWKFWDVRDTRTAYDLYNFDPRILPRSGTHHNALADAKHQVACLHAAVEKLTLHTNSVFS